MLIHKTQAKLKLRDCSSNAMTCQTIGSFHNYWPTLPSACALRYIYRPHPPPIIGGGAAPPETHKYNEKDGDIIRNHFLKQHFPLTTKSRQHTIFFGKFHPLTTKSRQHTIFFEKFQCNFCKNGIFWKFYSKKWKKKRIFSVNSPPQ